MKGLEDHKNNILQNTNNCNQKKTINNLLSKHTKLKNCKTNKRAKKASTRRYSNNSETSQEKKMRTLLNEFGIQERTDIKTFDYADLMSTKSCTSYYFGEEPIEQKAFICAVCDARKKILCAIIAIIIATKNVEIL